MTALRIALVAASLFMFIQTMVPYTGWMRVHSLIDVYLSNHSEASWTLEDAAALISDLSETRNQNVLLSIGFELDEGAIEIDFTDDEEIYHFFSYLEFTRNILKLYIDNVRPTLFISLTIIGAVSTLSVYKVVRKHTKQKEAVSDDTP
jgi:hypothetical protein